MTKMKTKYLMISLAVLTLGTASCTRDAFDASADLDAARYEAAFIKHFGQPAPDQDWGFGTIGTTRAAITRSQAAPEVLGIVAPYDEDWVATYNQTAKEPTDENTTDNFDNTTYQEGTPGTYAANYNAIDDWTLWNEISNSGKSWDEQVAELKAQGKDYWLTYTPGTEGYWKYDETYVTNFKITGTYNGYIDVAGSEGIMDNGTLSGAERTIVVTGTWNITENQRIGSLGKIIIASGGTVNVAKGVTLNMVNQARLVVLAGGKLTGDGKVEVNNGNASDKENYNGGTIDVATFNNNFGKFYNYGKFLVNEYQGGAQESNFYNHALAAIDHFGPYDSSTANARIFNGCQFYVKSNARIRNYEGVGGSALIVGGELMFSGSEDGTTTPSYVGLAAGALVQCGTLYNNGTSWSGPTTGGYAALNIVEKITFLNWEQDAPQNAGYFENNIYVAAGQWDNIPGGNGWQAGETAIADYKFFQIVANSRGNGGVKKVKLGNSEVIPASDNFVLGESGCTPGFKIDETVEPDPDPTPTPTPNPDPDPDPTPTPDPTPDPFVPVARVLAEDLSASEASDFDFNDVVFDVMWTSTGARIRLVAAGGRLPLTVGGQEVHELFGVPTEAGPASFINTLAGKKNQYTPKTFDITGDFQQNAVNIPVLVYKNGEWKELKADRGKAASKICVDPQVDWCDEYQDIELKFPNFDKWVKGQVSTYY